MDKQQCPNCSAPLSFYNNSNGSSTYYCHYCNYRKDIQREQKTSDKVLGLVNKIAGEVMGYSTEGKLSPIEIMDREKEIEAMKAQMTDKQRRMYEKQEALNQKRQSAYGRAKKTFNPKTGMYE